MRKAKRVDVRQQHQMKVYRFKAVFDNAPDLPITFSADTESGYRRFSHFESEDGAIKYTPRAVKDFDRVDGIKEVDG